jgi:hypothetical protein
MSTPYRPRFTASKFEFRGAQKVRDAVVVVYASIAQFAIGVALIALGATLHVRDVELAALAAVLAGVVVLLAAIGMAVAAFVRMSDPITYEVKRTGLLGPPRSADGARTCGIPARSSGR